MSRTTSALMARLTELSMAGAVDNAGRELEDARRTMAALEDRLRQLPGRRDAPAA